jgi:hypothetical protein
MFSRITIRKFFVSCSILVSFAIGASSTPVQASVASSKCSKVGATKRVKSVSFVCARSGKKIMWVKQTKTKSPANTSATPVTPTGWSDLEKYASAIPYASWLASSAAIAAGTSKAPAPQNLNGTNVVITNASPETAINLASRLFSNAPQPSQMTLLRYGFGDVQWAQSQWSSTFFGQDSSVSNEIQNTCSSTSTCWGGVARTSNSGSGWIALASMQANANAKDSRHVTGAIEAHEYVHLIQTAPFLGVSGRSTGHLPRWLLEGMATYSQAAVLGATSYDAYAAERRKETNGFKYGSAWLETFLAPTGTDWSHWNSYGGNDSWRVYDAGFLATEVLVALKGPGTAMQLYRDVAAGQTFNDAFAALYGISWAEAYKVIARVIAIQVGS